MKAIWKNVVLVEGDEVVMVKQPLFPASSVVIETGRHCPWKGEAWSYLAHGEG